jgi:hypothetical protein
LLVSVIIFIFLICNLQHLLHVFVPSSIYGVHDEAKDKDFELEMSWVCDESNRQHEKVRHQGVLWVAYIQWHIFLTITFKCGLYMKFTYHNILIFTSTNKPKRIFSLPSFTIFNHRSSILNLLKMPKHCCHYFWKCNLPSLLFTFSATDIHYTSLPFPC